MSEREVLCYPTVWLVPTCTKPHLDARLECVDQDFQRRFGRRSSQSKNCIRAFVNCLDRVVDSSARFGETWRCVALLSTHAPAKARAVFG